MDSCHVHAHAPVNNLAFPNTLDKSNRNGNYVEYIYVCVYYILVEDLGIIFHGAMYLIFMACVDIILHIQFRSF